MRCWQWLAALAGARCGRAGRAARGRMARRPAGGACCSCCRCRGGCALLARAAGCCRCCGRRRRGRPTGRFELVAADVGQGTAVLVRTRDAQLLVYDSRPALLRATATPASACSCRCCARAASAHRPAGAEPPRQRPRRRRRSAAAAHRRSTRCSSSLEAGHPLLGGGARRTGAARPASAGTGTACASRCCTRPPTTTTRAPSRTRCRACCASPAAGRSALLTGDIERDAGGGARRRARRRPAQRRAARRRTTAARPRRARPSSTPCGRGSRCSRPATATASAIRPPEVLGALPRARHRASCQRRAAAPGTWRADGARRGAASATSRGATGTIATSRSAAECGRCCPVALDFATLPEKGVHEGRLRRDAQPLAPRCASTTAATTAGSREQPRAGDAGAPRRGRDDLPPRRHHLRGLRRQGRGRRRHRAADPVRPDPAHHPGARVAQHGSRACASACTALNRFIHDVYHDQEILKAGVVPGRAGARATRSSAPR